MINECINNSARVASAWKVPAQAEGASWCCSCSIRTGEEVPGAWLDLKLLGCDRQTSVEGAGAQLCRGPHPPRDLAPRSHLFFPAFTRSPTRLTLSAARTLSGGVTAQLPPTALENNMYSPAEAEPILADGFELTGKYAGADRRPCCSSISLS
ncbi:hypothetical protein SKAU_G00398000 [Synaphobranchus kaupii]|uniref:Uncharacterized protein n=1 Tax=Synaphobranchus kaupii TaxID=118154 RepID=A0A9Q1E8G3_SYNKA|nr:hypothetical protein SKAU_G00398000 [Synaphobranchus kaupii]